MAEQHTNASTSRLGRGLASLIGDVPRDVASSESDLELNVARLPIEKIQANKQNPRSIFSEDELVDLANSIREKGIVQPIIVREIDSAGSYEVIAGERRWRACQSLEVDSVPVICREASDRDVLEMALIENLQREDLNPVEEAQAYTKLAKDFGMTQEQISSRVGKNRTTVANAMRLLDLAADVQKLLASGEISVGHAKVILSIKSKTDQAKVAALIIKGHLTVRATEKLIGQFQNPDSKKIGGKKVKSNPQLSAALSKIQDLLRERFATQVYLNQGSKKGKIEIEYYNNDDLERLLELMGIDNVD